MKDLLSMTVVDATTKENYLQCETENVTWNVIYFNVDWLKQPNKHINVVGGMIVNINKI